MTLDDFKTEQTLRLVIAAIPLTALAIAGGVELYRNWTNQQESTVVVERLDSQRTMRDYQFCIENTRRKIHDGIDYDPGTHDDDLAIHYLASEGRNDGTDLSLVRDYLIQKNYPISKLEEDVRTFHFFPPASLGLFMNDYCNRFARDILKP